MIQTSNSILQLTYYPLILIIIFYLLTLLYVFPVFVHYDIKLIDVLKNSFFIMIMRPLTTIMMVVATFLVYRLMFSIPGLIPIISVSIWAYVLMWSSRLVFVKLQQQQDFKYNLNLKVL